VNCLLRTEKEDFFARRGMSSHRPIGYGVYQIDP
jgi:hypothetical protein